jgi:hypothetical protein
MAVNVLCLFLSRVLEKRMTGLPAPEGANQSDVGSRLLPRGGEALDGY